MTHGHERAPGQPASAKQESGREADESQAHDDWLPEGHNVNQVRDEPIPASHHDDGRPEADEESPGVGHRGASRPGGEIR